MRRSRPSPVHALRASALLAASLLASCGQEPTPFARAYVITSLDQTIGGPKALARPADADRPGDLILENDRIRLAILSSHNSMGPGAFGGSIVDADVQWNDPRFSAGNGLDQLAEVFTTANMNLLAPLEDADVEIVSDGSDGGAAIIRVTSKSEPYLTVLDALWAIVGAPDFHLITDYVLEPGKSWVRVDSTVIYGWDGEADLPEITPMTYTSDTIPVIQVAVEEGVVGGDFTLQGGSVDVFAPGLGFDEDGAVFAARGEGRNLFLDPFGFDFVAGVGDGVSYGVAGVEGLTWVPLFTASQTATFYASANARGGRRAFSYSRYFFVGDGDVGSVLDGFLEARGVPYGEVQGTVLEEGTLNPRSGYEVFVFAPGAATPYSHWRTDSDPRDDVPDGSFGGRLPVGDWELMVHRRGRPDSARVPITVAEASEQHVTLLAPRPGLLTLTVRDEQGQLVPSKVTLFRVDGEPSRNPALGDGFIGGAPETVQFLPTGQAEVELADGTYQAVASRGLEYELDTSEPFVIDAVHRHDLQLTVVRSVDTEGWISADLHVHARPSHDSGVSLAERVWSMACEGVEFFAGTDHDFVTDYAPVIEDLGLTEWVQSAPGNEITTLEAGHYLGFPLRQDYLGDAGGATDWTGLPPEDLIEALRDEGERYDLDPFVFVGHPRAGILGYFDQYGFDPYSGTVGSPTARPSLLTAANPVISADNFTLEMDGIELLGTKDFYLFRTPTQPELDAALADLDSVPMSDILARTLEEQTALQDGTYKLGYGHEGQIDDWFTLLNLGFRLTAVGNSDTHDLTGTEAGCPRNFVMSDTDDPALLDDQAVADAVKAHRVVASYGPLVRLWVDGAVIGSDVESDDGTVEIEIEVQAPTWMDVDRVELYENGTLVAEFPVDAPGEVLRLSEVIERSPASDAWYVAIATGDGSLEPVFTPVEIPYIPLDQVVSEALGGVPSVATFLSPAVPIPLIHPVHPYALTNPIWVDVDGGGFDAPGLPEWLEDAEPVEPE
jgi:hypothetical protein